MSPNRSQAVDTSIRVRQSAKKGEYLKTHVLQLVNEERMVGFTATKIMNVSFGAELDHDGFNY